MISKPQMLGDAPIEDEYHAKMNALAAAIDTLFNGEVPKDQRKVGFVLLVYEFGAGEGRCNYISNAQREDVVVLLKEQLARFEGQPEMTGRA
jgi:hypothetical protein